MYFACVELIRRSTLVCIRRRSWAYCASEKYEIDDMRLLCRERHPFPEAVLISGHHEACNNKY